jgi:hypothetical protein
MRAVPQLSTGLISEQDKEDAEGFPGEIRANFLWTTQASILKNNLLNVAT